MFRRVTYSSISLLLLLPLIPMFIVGSFVSDFSPLNAMPIGSLYMLGLAFTLIPLALMPSKIESGSKLKLLRTVLIVACALFIVVTVFASTSPPVSGHVITYTTTHSHTFDSTTITYTFATTTTQCIWTTSYEYYYGYTSTECYVIVTGQTSWYPTSFITGTTATSTKTSYITPYTTVTYGESIYISPVIMEPKTTITYETTLYSYSSGTRTLWTTYTSTGELYSYAYTSSVYTTCFTTPTTTRSITTTIWGKQVDYTTVYQPTTVSTTLYEPTTVSTTLYEPTVSHVTETVTETTTETETTSTPLETAYGYLIKNGDDIYYIYGGKKFWITSGWAYYVGYGFRYGQWVTPTTEMALPNGYWLNGIDPLPPVLLPSGSIMGDESTGALYYIANGEKYWFTDMGAFFGYGFVVEDIKWVPHTHALIYADGAYDLDGTTSLPTFP